MYILYVTNPNPFAPGDFAKNPCDVVVTVWPLRNQTIKCRSQVNFVFFLHVSYSCNSNLNETKKIGDFNRIRTHGFCRNSVTIHFNLLQFCPFMITSFFYRDYTRPDLPSGPNESPFAGADIAGLAALGKQMLFFDCLQKCTCQCIHRLHY